MGKNNENIVDELEDVLGLNNSTEDNNSNDDNTSSSEEKENESENNDAISQERGQSENNTNTQTSEDKKTETQSGKLPEKENNQESESKSADTVTLTSEQVKINNEIAKIDTKLEDLEKNNTVDTDKFYDSLDEILTDEEQQLEHEDKAAYLKLIDEKKADYIKSNSKDDEIATLKEEKEDLEKVYARQEGIVEVTAKYPDFNYDTVMDFFENKLNKEQQQEVFNGASSYADVYENTYKMMTGKDTKEVKSTPAPKIPNVNDVRKENVSDDKLKDGLKTEDEELQEALGL